MWCVMVQHHSEFPSTIFCWNQFETEAEANDEAQKVKLGGFHFCPSQGGIDVPIEKVWVEFKE